jgi:predicted MPP superfamily phosphohydrolase
VIRILVALAVVVVLLGGLHYYLWRRLVRDTFTGHRGRRLGAALFVVLALLVPATFAGVRSGAAPWLAWPGYLWLALWFYLTLALFVLEVPRLLVRLRARRSPEAPEPSDGVVLSRRAAMAASLAAIGTVAYGTRTALGPPRLDRHRITLPRLPRSMDGTRLAVVSDIHVGPLFDEAHVRRIVERINDLDADVVAIVGDLVDGTVEERGAAVEPLRRITSKHGTFFVTGNHEYYSGYEGWIERLDELGVRTLRNERTRLTIRGGALDLAGVNDLQGTSFDDGPDFAATFADRDPDLPVVLMAHQPVQARSAAEYGVDLQVSGHTHGGQMWPFGTLARIEQPVVSGLGRVDGVPVYVTNGAGFWGPPVRVGAPPQVTLLELRSP